MYVKFAYAHKPVFQTDDQTSYLNHEIQPHVVNEPWLEDEATTTERLDGVSWSANLLALDGTDADADVPASEPMPIEGPSRWIQFKVCTHAR